MSTKTITVARNVLATLLALAAACLSPPAPAAVFTTNAVISESNTNYDGQDIVIDAATVAIDGPHAFHSLVLTNGAMLLIPTRSPNAHASSRQTLLCHTRGCRFA